MVVTSSRRPSQAHASPTPLLNRTPALEAPHPHRAHEGLEQVSAEQAQGGGLGEQHHVRGALWAQGGRSGAAGGPGGGARVGELTSVREQ